MDMVERRRFYLLLLLTLLAFTACREKRPAAHPSPVSHDSVTAGTVMTADTLSNDSIWARNRRLIRDSIMPGYKRLVTYYFQQYRNDSCKAILVDSADFAYCDGVKPFGRVRLNKPRVSVFLWPQLSWCDLQGDAWYFTDTSLPRLETASGLCYPSTLFVVNDINEDGVAEIAQLYTSCSSHFKSLHVYTLHNNAWVQVGRSTFDLRYMDPGKGFRRLVRKTGKGRFKMMEITQPDSKKGIDGKSWLKFSIPKS